MLDPRIAQRQIELERKKKQQQKNLQKGQNKAQSKPTIKPTPAISETPKSVQQNNIKTSYVDGGVATAPAVKQIANQSVHSAGLPATNDTKNKIINNFANSEIKTSSVYKPSSQIANNEYTTAAQRQQQNKTRQNYINRMQQKAAKEYDGYTQAKISGKSTNAAYGNVGGVKSSYSQQKSLTSQASNAETNGVKIRTVQQNNDFETLWNKYGTQLVGSDTKPKTTGPNAEIAKTTAQPKKEKSFFEKVENQTIDLIGGKRKSLFDWMDDFGSNKGPNNETAQTVKIKTSEKADLTAGVQGDKPQKPVEMYVSKDSVRDKYTPTEQQKLQNELLEYYGKIGRKGVEERHSLEPDASVYDTSEEIQHIIELENQLDMLDRADKAGLYDEDMSMLDRFGNTAKEWANRGLYSVDYIAQTAGTALTDYFESQLNEEYNYLINRRQDIVVQLNRITFGLDEDPYGKNEARLVKQLENINRYINENYREKMDTTTNAYRAMERAEKYEDKSVEGLSSLEKGLYNISTNAIELVPKVVINKYVPGYLLTTDVINKSSEKMHEINSSGGTAGQAFANGAVNAGVSAVSEKVSVNDILDFSCSEAGQMVLSEELAKYGIKVSKNVLEYALNYMIDLSAQNKNIKFSMNELIEKIANDYIGTMISTF